jgi:DNA polymerase III subunit delta'
MLFKDIEGYQDEKAHLINAVKKNQIAHAQLFSGKEGSANLALAMAYATYLNCNDRKETDSCGVCESCSKNQKIIHPDIHFAFPTSTTRKVKGPKVTSNQFMNEWRIFLTSNTYGILDDWNNTYGGEDKNPIIPVEESRKIIRDLSLKSFEGLFKILIMWLPELMNTSAANALLKILEEPPKNTVFILVSNQEDRLISTILSRTQVFHIRRFRDEEIRNIIQKKYQPDPQKLDEIVQLSDGNINYPFKLAEQNDDGTQDFFIEWMRNCYGNDYAALLEQMEKFQKISKMGQRSLLLFSISLMRETLIAQMDDTGVLTRFSGNILSFINDFKSVMNWEKIERLTFLLNYASSHLERNANPKILFLDLSLQIAEEIRS